MLYKNIIHWDWDLEAGEYVTYIRSRFQELNLDPLFKINLIKDSFFADIEVIWSSNIPIGTIFLDMYLGGFKRVKPSTLVQRNYKAYPLSEQLPIITYKK